MIWLVLGGLGLVLVAMAVVAARTDRNIIPVDADATWSTIGAFYRNRPDRTSEVDLGNQWTSELDPGAMFDLSWVKETRELVALRHQAHATMMTTAGLLSGVASPFGMKRKTGMKVLAVVDLRDLQRIHPHRLEPQADGLDQLTASLGSPYVAPEPAGGGASPAVSRPIAAVPPIAPHPEVATPDPEPAIVTVLVREPDVLKAVGSPRFLGRGATLTDVLTELDRHHPTDPPVIGPSGMLSDGLTIYLGNPNLRRDPARFTTDVTTALTDGDVVCIERRQGA